MQLQVLPLKNGVKSEGTTQIELLVRLIPEVGPDHARRPDLNVALVLDQSGSMAGVKLACTLIAASKVVDMLAPTDRLSVVLFDDRVQVLIPNTAVTDRSALHKLLGCVKAGGSTALHAGWVEGATQAALKLDPKALNRVLVLTDGQANVGEVDPDRISNDVNGLAQRGVTTSTLGFGSDYNEVLLRSMAASGNGNHHFVERPEKLGPLFELELGSLMSTVGNQVRLVTESSGEVEVVTRLDEDAGGLRLNDLIEGNPLTVLLRLKVPAGRSPQATVAVHYFCLDTKTKKNVTAVVDLPVVSPRAWKALEDQPEVLQEFALWEANNCRQAVLSPLMNGDIATAQQLLQSALARLMELPQTDLVQRHVGELREVLEDVASEDYAVASKRAVQQERAYSYSSVALSSDPRTKWIKRMTRKIE